jgi:hypothetical protein
MGGLGSVVVAVLMMLLLVPGAGVGDIPTTSPTAWLTWLTREINFVAGFMVNWMEGLFFVDGFRVAGFCVAGCWRCGFWVDGCWAGGCWVVGFLLDGCWV